MATTPAPPVPSPVAVIKPAVRRTHTSSPSHLSKTAKPSPSADRHGSTGPSSGNSGKGKAGSGETESGDDHASGGHGSDD